jgi:hypothetical protein
MKYFSSRSRHALLAVCRSPPHARCCALCDVPPERGARWVRPTLLDSGYPDMRNPWRFGVAAGSGLLFLHGCGGDLAPSPVRAAEHAANETASAASLPTPPCPRPTVFCDVAPPQCAPGEVPEAQPCPMGHCPGRCWTGRCVACGTLCTGDDDCELVGRHGCCGDAGDCAEGCFWAEARSVAAADPCYFAAVCPIPEAAPAGCPTECTPDARCRACPHCGPSAARCEAGHCVSAWTRCEPDCLCD